MIHEIIPVGMLQCNCSIFGDEASGEAVVIDPGDEIGRITAILDQHHLRVKAIIITHAHIDHIGGAQKLKALTGAPVYMNANDQELYDHIDTQAQWLGVAPPEKTGIDVNAREDEVVKLGPAEFRVLETGTNSVDIRVAEGSTYTSRTVISRGAATSGRGGRWFRRHTRKLASVGDSAGGTRSVRLWLKTWVAGACA